MTRELVLVHGRSQQGKDSVALKAEWVDCLRRGMAASGLDLPVDETAIRFPYYGDALMDLVSGRSGDEVADIVVRGAGGDDAAQAFLVEYLQEVKSHVRLTDEQVAGSAPAVVPRDIQNSRFVLAVLKALDEHVPGASGPALALATNDVYQYLTNQRIRTMIVDGVRAAMTPGVESVVVAHSLGSVVAFQLLRDEGPARGWVVPELVTVGCPLGVGAVRTRVGLVRHPEVVGAWFNARDPQDAVALFPLQQPWFDTSPAVTNKDDVDNPTANQHGISGYLEDPVVAKRIHDALVA